MATHEFLPIMPGQVERLVKSTDGKEWFLLFYKADSPFSNFHRSPFVLESREFSCVEQYFHYQKAKLFDDSKTASLILATTSPSQQKSLGRQVRNFSDDLWVDARLPIMKDGCRAKFFQNADLGQRLLSTRDYVLVEASPIDGVWGIKLALNDPKCEDKDNWQGQNLLGKVLMEIRDELLAKSVS